MIISAILFGMSFFVDKSNSLYIGLIFMGYVIIGGPIVLNAVNKTMDGQFFDEEFLMTIATFAAFCIGEYQEALAVMLFYQFGELLQEKAVMRSRTSLKELINLKAEYANLKIGNSYKKVDSEELNIGDIILIKPGEKVPVDGKLLEGNTRMNTSALTGESVPINISEGEEVLSGYLNETNAVEMIVEKGFRDSAVAKILDMVENASSKKAKTEKFITKFSRVYTPAVVILAAVIAVLMPIITGGSFGEWVYKSAIFLVISCPCALVISVPLGFFGGIGACSKSGILVKGGNYLEALSETKYVVLDKTGTLTEGVFNVQEIYPNNGFTKEEILEYSAIAESYSNHPIAISIVNKYGKEPDHSRVKEHEEIAGHGVMTIIDGKKILVGNRKLLERERIEISDDMIISGTGVLVAIDNIYAGRITISDEIKTDAKMAIDEMKKLGIKHIRMLTGDNKVTAEKVSKELGITEYDYNLLPKDKLEIFENILANKKEDETVVFVGDGINDAPTLARADVGIAMGGLGSDAAIEVSDIVIVNDEPSKISKGIYIAKKVKRIVLQNIALALGIKAIVLIFGVLGYATMWEAVFSDVGVSVLAVLNSMRALRLK
ncbi:MAG: heavy metal translocating P-type ATPase [Andreesenia angusta]|nr:heavy metal translocating P-type ATPase [Andreesenia angusta]